MLNLKSRSNCISLYSFEDKSGTDSNRLLLSSGRWSKFTAYLSLCAFSRITFEKLSDSATFTFHKTLKQNGWIRLCKSEIFNHPKCVQYTRKMRKNKQRNRHRVATLNQIPSFPNPTDNNLIYSEPISKISDWSSSIVIQSDLPSTKASYGWRQGSVARPYRNRFTSRADAAGRSNWTTARYQTDYGTCRQPPE